MGWKEMKEPVLLEEYADDVPAVSESVTVQADKPKGEWEVRAYFTNPKGLGELAGPSPGAHTGFKIYRDGNFMYSLDGGPSGPNGQSRGLGNLVFNGSDQQLMNNPDGLSDLGEKTLTPPKGVSGELFAKRMLRAAQEYDGSSPYSLPPGDLGFRGVPYNFDPSLGQYGLEIMPGRFTIAGNRMSPNEFNSNSFAAGLLDRAGASSNISAIQRHLSDNKWAAPGLEQPLPQRYFRNR